MTARGWPALAAAVILVASACFATWKVQDWRYGAQLADQAEAYQREREAGALAVIDWQEVEKGKHQALEDRLRANDQIHYKELTNAQANQARLRDRLATSDLRLSVLLAAPAPGSGCGVPASAGAGSVVHGAARGELDSAAAQRIVAITGDGDEGLKALQSCQSYVREINSASRY